ncbi:MAG: FkbM family methyltransferase [Alphaproteobacteria bacterium]|nr:FkbM family methyltransferase [Alphaproteobacteria bacterium]
MLSKLKSIFYTGKSERDSQQRNQINQIAGQVHCLFIKAGLKDDLFHGKHFKMYVPNFPTDEIQRNIVLTENFYENKILQDLSRYLDKNSVILDIGANIGNHSVRWGLIDGVKRVHAFEPVPDTYEILRKNIAVNKLEKIVTPHNFGLSDKESNAYAHHPHACDIGTIEVRPTDDRNSGILLKRLDDLNLKETKINLIKIDVESVEENVLKGAVQTIKKHRPLVFVESFPEDGQKFVIKFFKELGYQAPVKYPDYNFLFLPK